MYRKKKEHQLPIGSDLKGLEYQEITQKGLRYKLVVTKQSQGGKSIENIVNNIATTMRCDKKNVVNV